MAIDLGTTLRKALAELQAKQSKLSRQMAMIQRLLAAQGPGRPQRRRRSAARMKPARKPMSAAAKKAVSQRMKAYWAQRRAEAAKGKASTGK